MSSKDKSKKTSANRDENETGSGSGGKGGAIEFRDFVGTGVPTRDDQLPYDERKRLLAVHKDSNEIKVKKQKETREQRVALKEGKISLPEFREGMGNSMASQYKAHLILANKAQFSGIDRQVNSLPNENLAETNNEKREELQYQYQLKYMPEHAPRFHPKPQFNK